MTKSVLKHKVTFDEFCTKHTKVLCKLLRKDHEIYKNWLDFMVNEYTGLARDEQYFERIENSTIIALLTESIDCLDGVSILHRQGAVNPAYPLIRKLMELNFQIKFLLQSDTPNRALAFEAYYVSRKTKGEDNTQNIYLQFAKYSEYKKEADKIFEENYTGNYPEWYGVYDKVEKQSCSQRQQKSFINSIKKLCKEIGDNEIYNKTYNLISKNIHGIFSRDRIRLLPSVNQNYICDYRDPKGITYQTRISNVMMTEIYCSFCKHYGRIKSDQFLKNQFELINAIRILEEQYEKFVQEQDETLMKKLKNI